MQQGLGKIFAFCDIEFSKQNIKIKDKTFKRPWKSKDLSKCTKKPKKIILKGLAKIKKSSEERYKIYKTLAEKLKKKF